MADKIPGDARRMDRMLVRWEREKESLLLLTKVTGLFRSGMRDVLLVLN